MMQHCLLTFLLVHGEGLGELGYGHGGLGLHLLVGSVLDTVVELVVSSLG